MNGVAPCSQEVQAMVKEHIEKFCKDMNYPPGTAVLIAQPDGGVCNCYCGGAPAGSKDAGT